MDEWSFIRLNQPLTFCVLLNTFALQAHFRVRKRHNEICHTPLLETGLCLPKMQPHRLGIVWYRVDMRDNFWSQIGSTAVVYQNKQLAERGISEESCQPRTLAISLQPIVFGNSPRLPKVEFVCAECLCSSSWALSLGCVLSTSNAITFFYQSSQFSIYFSRYSS